MSEQNKSYKGQERRKFIRLDYSTPLAYKVCKEETVNKLLEGYTANVSQEGIFCKITEKVSKDDIIWLSFDRSVLNVCEDIEKKCLIYQNGVIGKVVRVEEKEHSAYGVGVQFITREEKNLTNIYPKVYFLEKEQKNEKK